MDRFFLRLPLRLVFHLVKPLVMANRTGPGQSFRHRVLASETVCRHGAAHRLCSASIIRLVDVEPKRMRERDREIAIGPR